MVQDGQPVGIGGLYRTGGIDVVFSRINGPVRRRVIVQVSHLVMDLARSRGKRVFAIRDATVATSASLLKHFGFQFVAETPEGEFYQWHG